MTKEEKQKKLDEIAGEIERCAECKKGKSGKPVPGEGNPEAKIFFLGEAPGVKESETGQPFVGRSGKHLSKLLAEIGLKRENVYITSPVKYFPGKRAPTPEEIEHGKTHLLKQLEVIKPKLIILLGGVAIRATLGKRTSVLKDHGKIIENEGVDYFITFHPSAAIRFTRPRLAMADDFKKLKRLKLNF